MKKKLFIVCAAFVWTVALVAQNIAVVSPQGETSLYKTLKEAINGAVPESVIYLPGGSFECNDTITKKLTIIGIGYKSKAENPDGISVINGNVSFFPGSNGSALMGCFISGDVYVGEKTWDGESVNDILIRYCRMMSIHLVNTNGTVVNQNIIYKDVYGESFGTFGVTKNYNTRVTNNIIKQQIQCLVNANICYNICLGKLESGRFYTIYYCKYSTISNNIIIGSSSSNDGCNFFDNMTRDTAYNDSPYFIDDENYSWNNVFVKYDNNNNSNLLDSDFHLKGEYKQYEDQVGIYAGDGFNDKQLAPVPYIVAKHVDEQTDAAGKLNIKIRVKAGDSE